MTDESGAPVSPEPAAPPPCTRCAGGLKPGHVWWDGPGTPCWVICDHAPPVGVVDTPLPTADVLRRLVAAVPGADGEIYCPSIDGCCFCGDCECDGIACIAALDPDDENDHEAIEQLHAWLRRGRLWEQAENFLAVQENRAGVRRG